MNDSYQMKNSYSSFSSLPFRLKKSNKCDFSGHMAQVIWIVEREIFSPTVTLSEISEKIIIAQAVTKIKLSFTHAFLPAYPPTLFMNVCMYACVYVSIYSLTSKLYNVLSVHILEHMLAHLKLLCSVCAMLDIKGNTNPAKGFFYSTKDCSPENCFQSKKKSCPLWKLFSCMFSRNNS